MKELSINLKLIILLLLIGLIPLGTASASASEEQLGSMEEITSSSQSLVKWL